jgi:glutathione S-transferase
MTITLYESPMSSASPVVQALTELGVPWERVTLDLQKNEQKKPELLALNPNAKVPTLVIDGTPMFEALAIMMYLGDRFGVERKLWPAADDPARMQAMAWSTWAYVTYGSAIGRVLQSESDRLPKELHNAAQSKRAREELAQLLTILNEHLADRKHILGGDFTLADLIVCAVVTWGTYCNIPITDYENVSAWAARFQERPSFKKVWAAETAS